ncbi:uncharacterized protein E5676_scaffold182G001000 [Cucumis melo var. makuwa]|uniref:Transmembrane protein n=2 Tax=Cucumis melo TaxID=3656 RepID=A0A5D3BB07_CUCMM|nr:uncharacterized protein E5676_scaffold182G001000 [Cucumis melo var. makuwa]
MLSLQSFFNQNQRPPFIATKKCSDGVLKIRKFHPFHYSASHFSILCARESDSQQFEVDPDKARQALQELDQQLQSFSKKQVSSPKKKVVQDMNLPRSQMRGEMTEIPGTLLANSAVVLFIFSIFYNVLFYTVIKPSIDGPLPSSISSDFEKESTRPSVLQQLPLSSMSISPSLLS